MPITRENTSTNVARKTLTFTGATSFGEVGASLVHEEALDVVCHLLSLTSIAAQYLGHIHKHIDSHSRTHLQPLAHT